MGPKQRKQRDNYWDSDQADKDREEAEKRATGKDSESESESSSSEEEVVKKPTPASSKKKPAAKAAAAKKQNGGKKAIVESSSSEEESSSEEDSESSSEDEPVPAPKKKPAAKAAAKAPAKPTPAPAKKGGKKQRENYWDSDQMEKDAEEAQKRQQQSSSSSEDDSESESSSEEEVPVKSTPKKQEPTKPSPAKGKKEAPAKPAAKAAGKKQAANKKQEPQEEKISAFLLKQRQEEEKKVREAEEKRKREEEERIAEEKQRAEEEEARRIRNIEKNKLAKERKEKEAIEREERQRQERIDKLKALGMNVGGNAPPPKKQQQKKKEEDVAEKMAALKVEEPAAPEPAKEDDDVGWDDDDFETQEEKEAKKEEEARRAKEEEEAKKKAEKEAAKAEKEKKKNKTKKDKSGDATSTTSTTSTDDQPKELRSPILCILGHVDTGKTSLLDKIRSTNVQGGEARGITQQIGASFIPVDAIKEQTKDLAERLKFEFKLPGLLLIDTPGHESFNNLRSRGSGLCDLAILVIDIMHGLEAQTIESINLLRMRKTPFIVALNKVDRIYDWRPCRNVDIRESLKVQSRHAAQEFDSRVKDTVAQLAVQELNASLYWKNPDHRKYVSLVPTSAVTGEGISDLMILATQLMQKMMAEKVTYREELQCTILEVKTVEGLGATVDAVLVNGVLSEGDKIVVSGFGAPIVSTIRSLLTPPPLRETRVKTQLIQNKSVKASMGVKIVAPGLEKAVPGTSLLVCTEDDDLEDLKEQAQSEIDSVLNDVETSGVGVSVQASTLGSLEAFLNFLKKIKVPVANVAIGPVHKKNVMACSIMREKDPKYAIMLAFDVKVEETAQQAANDMKIQIMCEDTIYLFEKRLEDHFNSIKEKLREETANVCVWPCLLDVIRVFRKKDPVLVGVRVKEGTLRIGTPLIQAEGMADIGVVQNIKLNEKDVQVAEKGDEVSISINDSSTSTTFGRHFDDKKVWFSKISRDSIDALKQGWGDELTKQDVQLIKYMKQVFKIQ